MAKPKTKFRLVITSDNRGYVYVDDKQVKGVDRIYIFGEPYNYNIAIRQIVLNENGKYVLTEDGKGLVRETKTIEIGRHMIDEEAEGTVE